MKEEDYIMMPDGRSEEAIEEIGGQTPPNDDEESDA